MKVTKSYIKQLVKEELDRTLGELFTPVEKFPGESEEEFKDRRMSQRRVDRRNIERQNKLSGYEPSEAARFAFRLSLEAAAALGFSTGDSSQGSHDVPQLDSNGEDAYFKVKMGSQTISVIYEPVDNERVLGVRVATSIKGLKEKMKEMMGSNPKFSIRFI